MSKYLRTGLLIGTAAIAVLLLARSCQKEACIECKGGDETGLFVLEHKVPSDKDGFVSSKHGKLFVQTPNGKLSPLDKRKDLEPACFSTDDYLDDILRPIDPEILAEATRIDLEEVLPRGRRGKYPGDFPPDYMMSASPDLKAEGNLWAMDLTWNNTTITFVNFNKDGGLESRVLTQSTATKSETVYGDINKIMQASSTGSPVNEYKAVQYFLTNLVHNSSAVGRPPAGAIQNEGFDIRNLSSENVPKGKTPFYRKFKLTANPSGPNEIDAKTGHVFFYVLLDDNLKYHRDTAATIPYTPQSAGTLYSPYVQYPIIPDKGLMGTNPEKVDVMTVHFLQGGTMTQGMGANPKCSYPFDIGVIAASQNGWNNFTPLLIDPETETDGPLP